MNTTSFEDFKSFFTPLTLKKNEFLVREKEVCKYFCFIEEGILQHALLVDDEEKTTYLSLKNSFTSSLKSFLLGVPSRKHVKAIHDCKLWIIDQ